MRRFCVLILLSYVFSVASLADSTDPQQYLHDHYLGKTLGLRGFYAGDKLAYNSSGALASAASSDDWTTNGFLTINRVQLSHGRVSVEAARLLVIVEEDEFRLRPAMRPGPINHKKPLTVKIEADTGTESPSVDVVDRMLSRVFLTSQDRLSDLIPEYWKPCVPQALVGKDKKCHFSQEIMAIPGIAPAIESHGTPSSSDSSDSSGNESTANVGEPNPQAPLKVGQGVKPPKLREHYGPQFSDAARAIRYQGTTTLRLIVDRQGMPQKIRTVSPLGCGLDWQAFQAVSSWRFQPAEKDGEPVDVEIAVEVDFHLY